MSRRALVIGSTGHIGSALTRELLDRGYLVTATTRAARPSALEGLDVEVARGDADRPGQIAAWADGHDVIVDAAAPYPVDLFLRGGSAQRSPIEHARRRAEELVEATRSSGATLGFVSSFTTLPRPEPPGGREAMEATLRRRLHPYFEAKATMEAVVLSAARAGVPAAVVNPSTCLGPWDRKPAAQSFIPQLLQGGAPVTVRRPVNVIDVRDVAAALCSAIDLGHFGTPIALAGHNLRVDDLADRICAIAGVRAPAFRTSARLAAATTVWAEAAWALVGRPSPFPALWSLLVLEGYAMEPSPRQLELGTEPRPLDETLRDAIAWYRRRDAC